MPRIKIVDIDPDNVDADGVAELQAITASTAMTLNGALGTTLDYARQLGVHSASDINTVVFTIVGKDANENVITETVTNVNNSTIETTKYYKVVTSVTPSGTSSSTVEVGTVDEVVTQAIPLEHVAQVAATVAVDVTGTVNYTVQETFMDVLKEGTASVVWADVTAHATKTADTNAQISVHATAVRLVINSYTSTAEIQMRIVQSRA